MATSAVDLRRVGDRGGRPVLLRDLVLLDVALAKASSPKMPFGMSCDDLVDLDTLGVVVRLVFDAADVRVQRVRRDRAHERWPRSGSAFDESSHPPLLGLDLPQGRRRPYLDALAQIGEASV